MLVINYVKDDRLVLLEIPDSKGGFRAAQLYRDENPHLEYSGIHPYILPAISQFHDIPDDLVCFQGKAASSLVNESELKIIAGRDQVLTLLSKVTPVEFSKARTPQHFYDLARS